ncbi:MAG TPA: tRNA preQ1(34) S-adenosylmethionine ribosyltransferase-isomerase QueA [Terriglobales bacterium]|nr:tRNA preQ1(34) S-adenosylmethionine ribosyltransferase-isomerase QueA [Terriglobales bacterium]
MAFTSDLIPLASDLAMRVSDFHFDLPPESIAQEPLADRANSRLLHLDRKNKTWHDLTFRDFPNLLRSTDLLVLNNTKVFPARLYGHRGGARAHPLSPHNSASREFLRGQVEVLLTHQTGEFEWDCLVRPGRKIGVGEKLFFGDRRSDARPELEAEVIARGTYGERSIRFSPVDDFFARVERLGHIPLPPYIDREDRPADRDRYQTVYAKSRGSVAAPTAGLHFTPEILEAIRARGIEIAEITLHVGLGTFQPVRVENVEEHKLHRESYEISPAAADPINKAKTEGRRVVAVGTTTVRTLEFAAQQVASSFARNSSDAPLLCPGRGEADIFIYPGYKFRAVDALLTNFHLPESTLLMLVSALAGTDLVMSAYRHAVDAGYRFYSYGDCMFIE